MLIGAAALVLTAGGDAAVGCVGDVVAGAEGAAGLFEATADDVVSIEINGAPIATLSPSEIWTAVMVPA